MFVLSYFDLTCVMITNCLYFAGITRLGTSEANMPQDIQLCGSHILKEHCIFENTDGVICLVPHHSALIYVNGREVSYNE